MVLSVPDQRIILGTSIAVWLFFSVMFYRKFSSGTPLKHSLLFALMFGAFGVPVFWFVVYLKFVVPEHGFIIPEFK
jgi:hypothetical protein